MCIGKIALYVMAFLCAVCRGVAMTTIARTAALRALRARGANVERHIPRDTHHHRMNRMRSSSSHKSAPSIVQLTGGTHLVHATTFKLRDERGRDTSFPNAPLFLAKKEDKQAVNFAEAHAKSYLIPKFEVDVGDARIKTPHGEREAVGFGKFDVHNFRAKHQLSLLKFSCLRDALAWSIEAMRTVESSPGDAGKSIVEDLRKTSDYDWLASNGYVDRDAEGIVSWASAPPRLATSKLLYSLCHKLRSTKDHTLFALPLPALADGSIISVQTLRDIDGAEAGIHGTSEVILFDPRGDLNPSGVDHRGVASDIRSEISRIIFGTSKNGENEIGRDA